MNTSRLAKNLIAVAALQMAGAAAVAQSRVTISVGLDLGVRLDHSSDGETDWQVVSGGGPRSHLTFSGSEELGDGMQAFFVLNHRFHPDTGISNGPGAAPGTAGAGSTSGASFATPAVRDQSSQFYRQSWGGLRTVWGEVRLGRMMKPHEEFNGSYDAWGTNTVASVHTGGNARIVRANDVVYCKTPVVKGLQLHAMSADAKQQYAGACSATPTAAAPVAGRAAPGFAGLLGIGASYKLAPLSVALAWDRDDVKNVAVGIYASCDLKFAKFFTQIERTDAGRNAANTAKLREDKYVSLSARIPIGTLDWKSGYLRRSSNLDGSPSNHRLSAGLDYWLSKRTFLYTNVRKDKGAELGSATGALLSAGGRKTKFDTGLSLSS